jgi:hypothetical protein
MPERIYGPSPATSQDTDDARSAASADTGPARAFLQHVASTAGLTPEAVAAALLRQGDPYLRHVVVLEIGARWGGRGVQQLLEAEGRLSSSSQAPSATHEPSSSSPAPAPGPSSPALGPSSQAPAPGPSSSSQVPAPALAPDSAAPSSQAHGTGQGGAHRSARERALGLSRLAGAHLGAIETALVPAYRRAVAAMDSAAVKALALQIVGGVARIVDAQAQVVRLVPQVDTGPHAAMASTSETDAFAPNAAELGALTAEKAALDAAVLATVPKLAVQVSPQWFGDQLVAGRAAEPPPHVREVLVQLTYEAGLVVQLLDEADTIAQLLQPVNEARGTSEPATDGARSDAVDHLERWRSRPINFLFLARVLTERGLWQSMQGKSLHGHTAAELQRKVFAQSKETGTTADVGALWDADEAHGALSYSTTDWKVTGEDASHVFEMLSQAEPRARGELVKQLYRMGRLGALCEHLPWGQVKQLWESIQDPEASKLLEPYWDGKGGGKSLGKRLEEQDHWYTDALNKFLDITTFGAKPRIDAAHDAREAGLISDDAYWSSVTKAVGRAAFVAAATAATGGVAGELVAGASEGMGLATGMAGRAVTTIASGATAGGVGNVAGHFIGDAYDQVLDGKEGFDSMSAYGDSFKEGAVLGGATAAIGLAAAKFLPKGMRTLAQETAAAHPKLTRLLEGARSVGVGVGTRVQTTVHEFLEWFGNGAAPPGFRLAYAAVAGGVVPARIASAPPGATVWVTVRPLQDLNAARPMQMSGTGDLVEVENVELSKEINDMFDDLSSGEGHTHPESESFASESSRLGESGPELDAVSVRETKANAGVVENPGEVATHQHHVFPQEFKRWFRDHGIDINDYCIELTPPEHQAQHGGGDPWLARRVAKQIPEAEWNASIMDRLQSAELRKQQLRPGARLTPEEILAEGKQLMYDRGVGELPFQKYQQ